MPLTEEQFDAGIREMAEKCFGYGRWDAPYWFIGPEQGIGDENELGLRAEAWLELGRATGLSDCGKFHQRIDEKRWHRESPPAKLQPTWRPLMLLLLNCFGASSDKDRLRDYQVRDWGMSSGETCVIELSGLPAKDRASGKDLRSRFFDASKWEEILGKRADFIRAQILGNHPSKPRFVVMYSKDKKDKAYWDRIAGYTLEYERISRLGSTMILVTEHPTAFTKKGSKKNDYWARFGEDLRLAAESFGVPLQRA